LLGLYPYRRRAKWFIGRRSKRRSQDSGFHLLYTAEREMCVCVWQYLPPAARFYVHSSRGRKQRKINKIRESAATAVWIQSQMLLHMIIFIQGTACTRSGCRTGKILFHICAVHSWKSSARQPNGSRRNTGNLTFPFLYRISRLLLCFCCVHCSLSLSLSLSRLYCINSPENNATPFFFLDLYME
jgi:hypothetical protein